MTNTKHKNLTIDTVLIKKDLKTSRFYAKPILLFVQSKRTVYFLKMGSPRMTRLLNVFLIFNIIFLLSCFNTKISMGSIILDSPNPNTKCFLIILSKFFLLEDSQERQYVLLSVLQVAFLKDLTKELMISYGRPMQDALNVTTAGTVQSLSSSLSSCMSSTSISEIWASFPKPSSSGISIHLILLKPLSVYLAVSSPIVSVLFSPKQTQTDFLADLTQLNIQLRKEFSDVQSNLIEIAPSLKPLRLELMDMALIKLVESRARVSFSPYINRPSSMSQKKLFNLLESLETNDMFLHCSNSPLIVSEEPSIIAFYIQLSLLFLWILFMTFFLISFTLSTTVQISRLHLC